MGHTASVTRQAAIDSGTRTAPSREKVGSDGRLPTRRADWSQSTADRDPVTARFGPRLRPRRRPSGDATGRVLSRTAAGRLLSVTAATAPTAAAAGWDAVATSRPGAVQTAASVPRAALMPKRPRRAAGFRASRTSRRPGRRAVTAAAPSRRTGRAGAGRAITPAAAAIVTATPKRRAGGAVGA